MEQIEKIVLLWIFWNSQVSFTDPIALEDWRKVGAALDNGAEKMKTACTPHKSVSLGEFPAAPYLRDL